MKNVNGHISNKPIPHDDGSGNVDYWQADILSAYDYSPFGVMLTGRTFEKEETVQVCHNETTLTTTPVLEEGFGSWFTWTTMGSALLTYVNGEMQVSNPSNSSNNIGASKTFTTGSGVHSVSFDIIDNTCATIVLWPPSVTPKTINVYIRDNANNVVASGSYTTAGNYSLSFTPATTGAIYKIEFYMASASAFCYYRIDDVLITYQSEEITQVCENVSKKGKYRYGYGNHEKINEVSGNGNTVDMGDRWLDVRLGRTHKMDVKSGSYPAISPYVYALNSPLLFSDPDGKDAIVTVQKNKNGGGEITISSTVYITGKNASSKLADWYNKKAGEVFKSQGLWVPSLVNGDYPTMEYYEVKFNINFVYEEDKSKIRLNTGDNILYFDGSADISHVTNTPTSNNDKVSTSGRFEYTWTTYFRNTATEGYIADDDTRDVSYKSVFHEVFHFLGLSDRYREGKNKDSDRETVPYKGFENDVMGVKGYNEIKAIHYLHFIHSFKDKVGTSVLNQYIDVNPLNGKLPGETDEPTQVKVQVQEKKKE